MVITPRKVIIDFLERDFCLFKKEGMGFNVTFNTIGHIATRLKPGTRRNSPFFKNSSSCRSSRDNAAHL